MNIRTLAATLAASATIQTCSLSCLFVLAEGCCTSCEPVRASSFGWNGEDATAALQAALDSGAQRVVVDDVGAPWNIRPVFLRRSNLEVVIADGVEVRAKRGAFKGVNDCLLTVGPNVSNVVLRGDGQATLAMNKKDYQDQANYDFSEWRHAVAISGGRDITVRDLTILSSGGDGVYVRDAAQNVRLDRLVCRDHHRQGISVISAVGLRVSNCVFAETSGTPPQCGVDIEPNVHGDRLEDIVFEDCMFADNASAGICLYLAALDGTTKPISIAFRRCTSRGNDNCGIRVHAAGPKGAVRGNVSFEDCAVSGNRHSALVVSSKRSDVLPVAFRSCTLDARGGKAEPVRFDNGSYLADFGGISFDGVRIVADHGRPIAFEGVQGAGIDADTMKGSAVVEAGGARQPVALADFSRDYPQNPEALRSLLSFKTQTPDFRSIEAASGVKPFDAPASTGWMRGRFTFVQCIPAAGDYPIVFRMRPLGGRKPEIKVQTFDALGTDLGSFSAVGAAATNVIHAKGACIRRFVVSPSGLASVESVWPGCGVQSDGFVHLFGGANRRFWFAVPSEADKVVVQVRPEEACSARLLRPDGSMAAEMPLGVGMAMLETRREKSAADETWCLEFPCIKEDAFFRIGAPAVPIASPAVGAAVRFVQKTVK